MDSHELYAHRRDADEINAVEQYQSLTKHLTETANRAEDFGRTFGSEEHCHILGLLHDVGKARRGFQEYISSESGGEESSVPLDMRAHSSAGAAYVSSLTAPCGRALAYCIAGHHAGLPDWVGGENPNGSLVARIAEGRKALSEREVAEFMSSREFSGLTDIMPSALGVSDLDGFAVSFWIRMLYSCLVDADFLNTEKFMSSGRAAFRGGYPTLDVLKDMFFEKLNEKQRTSADTRMNRIRSEIRSACERAAKDRPGLFSLTVPTGGGKTLSAMAFAFTHALEHGKKRIIYVIPYTSIIEQTADVLRGFLGADNVLEHHSNFDPAKETQQSRLASENWDAPVVVTTTVQFFESLYAYKPSRCRKLHNVADSVVILDEVQLLPTSLIVPCARAIAEISGRYGATVVLSTATQPGLPGLNGVREMIPTSLDLFGRLRRVDVDFPSDLRARRGWEEIAGELSEHRQVLCVVNTKGNCRRLHALMPDGTIHLSTFMCGEHRSRVIARIKDLLRRGEPVRVVSTQLIEAGVDVDFPVVYREFTGLASVVQSAGRCDREGLLSGHGRVIVFMPPEPSPRGELRNAENAMREMLASEPGLDALGDPSVPGRYFGALWSRTGDLGEGVVSLLTGHGNCEFQFREAADLFRMVGDGNVPLLVDYGKGSEYVREIERDGMTPGMARRIQRYVVSLPERTMQFLVESGLASEIAPGVFAQGEGLAYLDETGLELPKTGK